VFALLGGQAFGQGGHAGSITVEIEAERKSCTSCASSEHENEIETTPIELVLRPRNRRNLSYGLKVEYDVDSEGDFFGSGRSNIEEMISLGVWARREFSDVYWGRIQGEHDFSDNLLDIGARVGFQVDLSDTRELSGYLNVDRRFAIGSGNGPREGTYVEARLDHEWDWNSYGAWVELEADHWFYASAAENETRVTLQPGLWVQLGRSPHKGLIWLEGERRTRAGASNFKRDTGLVGIGAELDLGKGRELQVGGTFGREREVEAGNATRRSRVTGLFMSFEKRF
jgi:hypothetical protein